MTIIIIDRRVRQVSMARCLEWFADHPERWPEMGASSLETVQAHSLENMVHRYETLYRKLLAGVPLE